VDNRPWHSLRGGARGAGTVAGHPGRIGFHDMVVRLEETLPVGSVADPPWPGGRLVHPDDRPAFLRHMVLWNLCPRLTCSLDLIVRVRVSAFGDPFETKPPR
jgi:hypothetical protein